MNKAKLDNYSPTASIHTVQINSQQLPTVAAGDRAFIKTYCKLDNRSGEITSRNIINPHNFTTEELLSYSQFTETMHEITAQTGLDEYSYSRIDIRLDSYEDNYSEYFKLNCLLLGLFSMIYKFKNDEPTVSAGLYTRDECGVYVKNQTIAIDYYNKKKESRDRYPCKARLEFRELRANGKTPEQIAACWYSRLDRLLVNFEALQTKCNKKLFTHYENWLAVNDADNTNRDLLTAFIRENKSVIFTKRQLEVFCKMCGVKSPESRAKNIKKTCGIECFSANNVQTYINIVKESIAKYFAC